MVSEYNSFRFTTPRSPSFCAAPAPFRWVLHSKRYLAGYHRPVRRYSSQRRWAIPGSGEVHIFVSKMEHPAAKCKTAGGVFLLSAGCLHNTVKRHKCRCDEISDWFIFHYKIHSIYGRRGRRNRTRTSYSAFSPVQQTVSPLLQLPVPPRYPLLPGCWLQSCT